MCVCLCRRVGGPARARAHREGGGGGGGTLHDVANCSGCSSKGHPGGVNLEHKLVVDLGYQPHRCTCATAISEDYVVEWQSVSPALYTNSSLCGIETGVAASQAHLPPLPVQTHVGDCGILDGKKTMSLAKYVHEQDLLGM